MAGLSVASLLAFFGYFLSPPSWVEPASDNGEVESVEAGAGFWPVAAKWGIVFVHQRMEALPDIAHITGSGVALGDFDRDGRTDIFLLNSTPVGEKAHRASMLYMNRGEGRFEAVADAGGADPGGLNMGVVAADYDNDGDLDLFITRIGNDLLFRNDGTGHFEDVTKSSGINNERWGTSAAFADYDRDGDLDLFVANYVKYDPEHLPTGSTSALDRDEEAAFNPYLFPSEPDVLFRNEGNGTFTDVTAEAGIDDSAGKGLGVAFADLNADGWPDVYVVNDVSANALYVNQGNGRFVEEGVSAGVADPRGGMGITVGDYDRDGYLDLFSTHWQDEVNVLYRNLGPVSEPAGGGFELVFDDVTAAAGLSRSSWGLTGWGTVFFDADQDGDEDLYVTNGYTSPGMGKQDTCVPQPDRLLINNGGRYTDLSVELLRDVAISAGRGLAAGDLDGDGDLDLVRTANNGEVMVLENRLACGHWLVVEPRAPLVVGCEVSITCGNSTQIRVIRAGTSFASSAAPEAHFGLGSETEVPRLEVRWPDGRRQEWKNVPADRRLIVEPSS